MLTEYTQAPDARLDYGINWAPFLATTDGDSIASSEWLPPQPVTSPPLVLEDESVVGSTAYVFARGGVPHRGYRVTNRITTTQGRVTELTVIVWVKPT